MKKEPDNKEKSTNENLNDEYIDINENKTGFDRQFSEVRFYFKQWLNIFKTQTPSTVIGGIIFIPTLFFLLPYYLGKYFKVWFYYSSVGRNVGTIVGFASAILIGMIFSNIYRAIVIKIAKSDKKAVKTSAKVVASSFISGHIIQSGRSMSGSRKVLRVTYRVKLKVENKTSIAYSKNRYYNPNEEVEVLFNPKRHGHCIILTKEDNTKN